MLDVGAALERVGGDAGTLREVIDLLAQETPALLEEMSASAATGDWETLAAAAHSCKGMYLIFQPNPVEALARDIESFADRRDGTAAQQAVERLRVAARELHTLLSDASNAPN
jgi:HPt (histidine-containing phosphotransfer) domain-containing protein